MTVYHSSLQVACSCWTRCQKQFTESVIWLVSSRTETGPSGEIRLWLPLSQRFVKIRTRFVINSRLKPQSTCRWKYTEIVTISRLSFGLWTDCGHIFATDGCSPASHFNRHEKHPGVGKSAVHFVRSPQTLCQATSAQPALWGEAGFRALVVNWYLL